ncbi:unnamed protein product [Urochloa decumbens]|uniref:BED-type domain-containing protein n=1 Tax=Urochloa decumbens TaxID=240449 RepID=A0ABC9DXI6_9POAL
MVSRGTRSSASKQRSGPSVNEKELDDSTNVNASEQGIEADVQASGAAHDVTESETPTGGTSSSNAKRRKKRKTSQVWQHYTDVFVEEKVDDMVIQKPMAACKYCTNVLCATSKQGTTRLWNHYHSYHDENTAKPSTKKPSLDALNYDEEASIRKYYLAIIMHEYPIKFSEHEYTNDFIRSLRPNFPIMGRKGSRTKIMDIFYNEKKSLFDFFTTLDCQFSCTMDVWTSNQNKGYLCVTCHFIDDEWRIHKRIINFMHLKGRHTGANLSAAFMQNMASWNLDHKLFALTLDNASSNDVCVDTIVSILKDQGSVHCGGKFFHVRCAAHILNLIARDGLSTISAVIKNIRTLVVAIKSSPLQEEMFFKQAADLGIEDRGLSQDVCTRWNSTYLMLADALHFKRVFQRIILLHPEKYSKLAPSREEWDNAAALCNCLEIFYEATKLLSGSYYPTANLFFSEFCEINIKIIEWLKSSNSFIVSMAKSMKEKFDKYWEMSNTALAVACFLDPRYKMKVVEFYYSEMSDDYGFDAMYEFKKVLQKLYESYASMYGSSTPSHVQQTQVRTARNARTSHCYTDLNEEPKRTRLSSFLRDNNEVGQEQSELDQYNNEPLLNWKDSNYFDILSWWKTHGVNYPILARIARDVLAIPASTVASESAFSASGRVVHKYRSRLDPQIVEALICTKDWIRAARKDPYDVSTIVDDISNVSIDEVDQDGGASDAADHIVDDDEIIELED